ncbi:hypothetical protein GY45DRAFT_1376152 [Cubamyces sp. BRFM 1775]|nr:hypothetical protein GY45DRAFT_1376152 [Cubamyces sp. BRFM 1775]
MSEAQGGSDAHDCGSSKELHADVGQAVLVDSGSRESAIDDLYLSSGRLFTDEEKREAFTRIASKSKEYSEALVERWMKEIDTYLVYAGLFSAILTAFNVESYQLLQPSPPDLSPTILRHISLQLGSLSYIPPSINSTHPAINPSDAGLTTSSAITCWAVWLNTFWFSSLILSLSSASVGILVKQWLNEFQSGLSGDSQHIALLRQYRLNNIKRCHVGAIVNAIPILLQGALALFLAGLLVFLWNLHPVVAGVSSLFVLAIALFIIGTTVLPLITAHCAYLSPQSLVLYALWPHVSHLTRKILSAIPLELLKLHRKARAWAGLSSTTMTQDVHATASTDIRPLQQSWVARERYLIDRQLRPLETDMTLAAYEGTLDSNVIASATTRVLDWDTSATLSWFGRLVETDTFHFGILRDHFEYDLGLHGAAFSGYILLCATMNPSTAVRVFTDSGLSQDDVTERFLICLRSLAFYEPPRATGAPDSWGARVVWVLATHAVLHILHGKRQPENQPSSPPRTSLEHPDWQRLDLSQLNLMAIVMDIEALPEDCGDILSSSMDVYVSVAFCTLREGGYSLGEPYKHLGKYLRAHALLLYAAALRSRQIPSPEERLDQSVREALSDVTTTLRCLYHNGLDDGQQRTRVEIDIIRPLSYIVHGLSRELDSLAPHMPQDFSVTLETFFSAFKQSALFADRYWISVPWKADRWSPSDLYDAAQVLLTSLRDSTARIQDTRSTQYVLLSDLE